MKFSFAVDRSANMALGEQLLRKLQKAIVCGIYKPGEHLPCLRELAEAAGVSEKVASSRRWLLRRRTGGPDVAENVKGFHVE